MRISDALPQAVSAGITGIRLAFPYIWWDFTGGNILTRLFGASKVVEDAFWKTNLPLALKKISNPQDYEGSKESRCGDVPPGCPRFDQRTKSASCACYTISANGQKNSAFNSPLSSRLRFQFLRRHYLLQPSLHLGEAACLLGYEDPNSFFRAFREWEGTTPSEWRDLQKKNGKARG